MQKPICVSRCKITTFPQTRKGMEKILLQRIVFGCFLHELPLMYHELSLIVCFTRIAINVPRIVINCFWVLYQGADVSNSHVLPAQACAMAGICGCGKLESALLNIKTRHCISGCNRVVPLGLCPHCRFASSRGGTSLPRAERGGSDPFMTDLSKICFPKNIHFISNYLPDSKRLQSTTNV